MEMCQANYAYFKRLIVIRRLHYRICLDRLAVHCHARVLVDHVYEGTVQRADHMCHKASGDCLSRAFHCSVHMRYSLEEQ